MQIHYSSTPVKTQSNVTSNERKCDELLFPPLAPELVLVSTCSTDFSDQDEVKQLPESPVFKKVNNKNGNIMSEGRTHLYRRGLSPNFSFRIRRKSMSNIGCKKLFSDENDQVRSPFQVKKGILNQRDKDCSKPKPMKCSKTKQYEISKCNENMNPQMDSFCQKDVLHEPQCYESSLYQLRSSEFDPTFFQLELPSLSEITAYAKICSFMSKHEDVSVDISAQHILSQGLLPKKLDDLILEKSIRVKNDAGVGFIDIAIFITSKSRQIIVCFAAEPELQAKPLKNKKEILNGRYKI